MSRKSVEGAFEIYFDTEDEQYLTFAPGEMRPDLTKELWIEYVGSAENGVQADRAIREHAEKRKITLKGDKMRGEGI